MIQIFYSIVRQVLAIFFSPVSCTRIRSTWAALIMETQRRVARPTQRVSTDFHVSCNDKSLSKSWPDSFETLICHPILSWNASISWPSYPLPPSSGDRSVDERDYQRFGARQGWSTHLISNPVSACNVFVLYCKGLSPHIWDPTLFGCSHTVALVYICICTLLYVS